MIYCERRHFQLKANHRTSEFIKDSEAFSTGCAHTLLWERKQTACFIDYLICWMSKGKIKAFISIQRWEGERGGGVLMTCFPLPAKQLCKWSQYSRRCTANILYYLWHKSQRKWPNNACLRMHLCTKKNKRRTFDAYYKIRLVWNLGHAIFFPFCGT